jgi:hypothetical protein
MTHDGFGLSACIVQPLYLYRSFRRRSIIMPLSIEMSEASMSMADVDMSTMVAAKKTFSRKSLWDTLSFVLAACAAITSILAIAWDGSTITYVAMSFSLILSSAVSVQRFKLSRQESKFKFLDSTFTYNHVVLLTTIASAFFSI